MSAFVITGGIPLRGEITIQGSKNSALPLLAAALLNKGKTIFTNCPKLRDVDTALRILKCLGCTAAVEENTVTVDASEMSGCDMPDSLMREMRSSVVFLGAILARMRRASLYMPGGCELGPRPIDLHLAALRQMGVEIEKNGGRIRCDAVRLHACDIHLAFPSVGATENTMLAACGCTHSMKIFNAAREPEIVDLQDYLNRLGYEVSGAGTTVITIKGLSALPNKTVVHRVIPDRIAAGTYLCAAAASGGHICLRKTNPEHYRPLCDKFREMGCDITYDSDMVCLNAPERLGTFSSVQTMPYPGFPTDLQSPLMAAACFCSGTSVFVENIFDSRYRHVSQLRRMGASIDVIGRVAVVYGGKPLSGAEVYAGDLRGGAALVIAALGASGESIIYGLDHIDRGYEQFETVLANLGARIIRV